MCIYTCVHTREKKFKCVALLRQSPITFVYLNLRMYSNLLRKCRHRGRCLGPTQIYNAVTRVISAFKKCTAVNSTRACVYQKQVSYFEIEISQCRMYSSLLRVCSYGSHYMGSKWICEGVEGIISAFTHMYEFDSRILTLIYHLFKNSKITNSDPYISHFQEFYCENKDRIRFGLLNVNSIRYEFDP